MNDDITDIIERVMTIDGIRPHVCTGIYEFCNVQWEEIDPIMYEQSLGVSLPDLQINKENISEYERITLSLIPIEYDKSIEVDNVFNHIDTVSM